MNLSTTGAPYLQELDQQSDQTLRELITRARSVLAAREEKQKKDALSEIRRIAKAHGLDVAIRKPPARRGRPSKANAGD
jgi:uncharacterized protein HemY